MKWSGLFVALAAGSAAGQTMLDQEQRLIQIHSLLVALQPEAPPGAYAPAQFSLGVELIGIPTINGQTGGKTQITASDQTRVFPRPRLALGLPAPEDFRASVGIAYVPPIRINDVSSHEAGVEASYAWTPPTPLSVGLRVHAVYAQSQGPVSDLNCTSLLPANRALCTRDTLHSFDGGLDLSAGYRLDFEPGSLTPFAGVGAVYTSGHFRVTSDGELLTDNSVAPEAHVGLRLFSRLGIEAVAEVVAYPGVMVHPVFGLAWTPAFFVKHKS
jgi:hypothetical protein